MKFLTLYYKVQDQKSYENMYVKNIIKLTNKIVGLSRVHFWNVLRRGHVSEEEIVRHYDVIGSYALLQQHPT